MAPYEMVQPKQSKTTMNEGQNKNDHHHSNTKRIRIARDEVTKESKKSARVQRLEESAQEEPERQIMQYKRPSMTPFQRLKDEWIDPWSWFGMEECGALLDVPNSFGSTHSILKWLIWLWMFPSLIYLWTYHPQGAWFLGTLEHWALLFSVVYATMSLVNAHIRPTQPANNEDGVNTYLKIFWIVFEVSAHLEVLTTFLFWTITVHMQEDSFDFLYGTIVLHGAAVLAVWFDGMILNRIPVRIKHFFICVAIDFIYVMWTIIHATMGWDNGLEDEEATAEQAGEPAPEETSDAIYMALDWHDETTQTVFVAMLVLFAIAPVLYIFQWIMSLYTFPWTWDGSKSRRYIDLDMSSSNNIRGVHGTDEELGHSGVIYTRAKASRRPSLDADERPKTPSGRLSVRSPTPSGGRQSMRSPTPIKESMRSATPSRESMRTPTHGRSPIKSPAPGRQSMRSPTPTQNHRSSSTPRPSSRANNGTASSQDTPSKAKNSPEKGNWWERDANNSQSSNSSSNQKQEKSKSDQQKCSTAPNGKRRKSRSSSVPKSTGNKPTRQRSKLDIA